jgi:hypothetical protein
MRGIALPVYPDRFPEWSHGVRAGGGHPDALLVRPGDVGREFLLRALRSGGRVVFQARGITIVSWR